MTSAVESWSMPSIDTLDSQSTLDRYSINTLVDTQSTGLDYQPLFRKGACTPSPEFMAGCVDLALLILTCCSLIRPSLLGEEHRPALRKPWKSSLSINSVDCWSSVDWMLIECRLSVGRVSINMSVKCWVRCWSSVNQGYRSTLNHRCLLV